MKNHNKLVLVDHSFKIVTTKELKKFIKIALGNLTHSSGRTFCNNYTLRESHLPPEFKCGECGARFFRASSLARHVPSACLCKSFRKGFYCEPE